MGTAEQMASSGPLEMEDVLGLEQAVAAPRRTSFRDRRLPLMAVDGIAIAVAQCAALATTASLFREQREVMWDLAFGAVWITGLWLLLLAAYGHYGSRKVRISSASYESVLREVAHPLIVGGFITMLLGVPLAGAFGPGLVEPETVAASVGVALVLVPAARVSLRSGLIPRLARPERTIIVGSGEVARLLHDKISRHSGYGIELVGFLDDDPLEVEGCAYLGTRSDLAAACAALDIDRVVIAYSRASHGEMLDLVRSVRSPDIQISMVPRYFEIFPAHATLDDLEGIPMITLPQVRLGGFARVVKRAFDIVVAGGLLVLLAPALAAIAIAIRIDSPGPALFRQLRRGRDGSAFNILKFRSMTVDAEQHRGEMADRNEVDGPLFKLKSGDPRATRVGAFLRRTSLDELPQLWNVLRGQMSMVGPRPFVVHEADQITGWASRRLDVAPGLTGLWQAMGRNDLPYAEMAKLDYLYVTNWSLWWDIRIMMRTARVVLRRDGAY